MTQVIKFIETHFVLFVLLLAVVLFLMCSRAQTITPGPGTNAFSGVSCTNCSMSNASFTSPMTLDGDQMVVPLRKQASTATDGTYTWSYGRTFAATPTCEVTAQATSGSTDIVNAQFDGAPGTTSLKVRVTRSTVTVSGLLSLTIPAIQTTPGAIPVYIVCYPQ